MLRYNFSINEQPILFSVNLFFWLPFWAIIKSSTFSSYAICNQTPLYLVAFNHSSYSSCIHLLTILYAIWKDNFLFKILIMGCGIQLFRIIRKTKQFVYSLTKMLFSTFLRYYSMKNKNREISNKLVKKLQHNYCIK